MRNGIPGGLALAATALIETLPVTRVAATAERKGWGILPRLGLRGAGRTVAAVVLLDYGMFLWHMAMHRVPVLWRLHLVHHVDRDLDVTTALRIHTVEIVLSIAIRLTQVVALGVTPGQYAIWQRLFAGSILFHHSNLRLPPLIGRILGFVIVTPRHHAIHHLARRDLQHGNWSSGLMLWDWLHGTLRDGDPCGDIGVPAYRDETSVTLGKLLALPFTPQPDPWSPR